MKESFDIRWLIAREQLDEARSPTLVSELLALLEQRKKDRHVYIDLGSGIGNNFVYLFPKILESVQIHQKWVLIEIDPKLAEYSLEHIQKRLSNLGFNAQTRTNTAYPGLNIEHSSRKIEIEIRNNDFMEVLPTIKQCDGIFSNAVMDLLTWNQVNYLLTYSKKHKSIFYATLNYRNTTINSTKFHHPKLSAIGALYDAHMILNHKERLGNKCCEVLKKIAHDLQLISKDGRSVWKLDPNDNPSAYMFLLKYIGNAMEDMYKKFSDIFFGYFENIEEIRGILESDSLMFEVDHCDFLAY